MISSSNATNQAAFLVSTSRFLKRIRATSLAVIIPPLAWSLEDDQKPNIVFILSDNQSYYEMSCHGHADIKTPHIDALAKESIEFTHFYAPPFCSPSRSVIMTGRPAMESGVFTTIGGRSIMHREQVTLPELLRQNGYHTSIFGKWHLGFSYPYRPKDRGFDEIFVHGGGGVGQMEDYYGNTLFDTTFIHNDKVTPTIGYCTDTLFDYAMEDIANHQDTPFFCFVSTPVTHSPHHGPIDLVAELKTQGIEGNLELYAQVINLDKNIGRMMTKLDELDLAENTILIYASDQGMNDRGAPHGDNRLGLAYDPAHHVPFFARIPGTNPTVCDRLTGMIDLFPTLLDFCGIESPVKNEGLSLRPLLTGHENQWPKDRTLIIQCPRGRTAEKWQNASVKTERWRLTNGEKLYDIQTDPRQRTDLAAEHPDVVARLRSEYEAWWNHLPDQDSTLSRHLLGAAECPEVVLNGMDWYRGASPWNKGAFKGKSNGAWAVTVLRDGPYVFECRHYPREADLPAEATHARLVIGDNIHEVDLDENATHARFEVELKAGDYDLETFLSSSEGKSRGALFVYVTAK
jgi:arylsulfatase A-like enzyme